MHLIVAPALLHHSIDRFALVNVGLVPLLPLGSLAKGTGLSYVEGISFSIIDDIAVALQLVDVVHIPDFFDFPSKKFEIPHFASFERPLDGPVHVINYL
jgi:hypothetical protein